MPKLRRNLKALLLTTTLACATVAASIPAASATATTAPTAPTSAPTASAAAIPSRSLLVGQNNTGAWNDLTSATGASPAGGSVYYSVRDGAFSGTCQGNNPCQAYLAFLGQRGAGIEVGVDWKDNPPGWDGQNGDEETASQQATEAIAQGTYDAQFNALVAAIKQYPSSTFYLRLDYEVSTAFDCLNGTNCSSYTSAFRHLVTLIRNESGAGTRVQFVYHPVRGEFDQLYPGDRWVDWIGLSVFDQDLCQPYWENGTTYWNGQENTSDRTCLGYYDFYVVAGNTPVLVHNCGTGNARFVVDSSGTTMDLTQDPAALSGNPLEGTTYTGKVQSQIASGDLHAFPAVIDTLPTYNDAYGIVGGDGVGRLRVTMPGAFNGSPGSYDWIIEQDGSVNHRFFDQRMR